MTARQQAAQDYILVAIIMAILIAGALFVVHHPLPGTALHKGDQIAPERLVPVPVSDTVRKA